MSGRATGCRRGVLGMGLGLGCVTAAAVLRVASVATLRVDHVPLPLATHLTKALLLALGFTLLCASHLKLIIAPASRQEGWRGMVAAAVVLHLLAGTALPLLSNDIFSNINYGHLEAHQGINPYTVSAAQLQESPLRGWVSRYWATTPSVYGPLLTAVTGLAARLGGPDDMLANVIAFKALMLLFSLALVLVAWLYARRLPDEGLRRPVFWMLAASPVWLVEIPGQAHNDGVMVVLVTGALVAHRYRRGLLWAALLALGIAAKYVAAVPLLFLFLWELWHGRRGLGVRVLGLAGQAAVAAAVLVLAYALYWDGWATLTRPLSALGGPKFAYSLLKLIYWGTLPLGEDVVVIVYRVLWGGLWLGLLYMAARWIRAWTGEDPELPFATAGRFVLLHTLLINSHYLPWYLTWLLPLLVCERDRRWWIVQLVYGYLSLMHYALELPFPGEEAVNTLLIHVVPLVMVIYLVRGKLALGSSRFRVLRRLDQVGRL